MFETRENIAINMKCLNKSQTDERTLKMIQEGNGSQLPQIRKQMQKFVDWSPDTVQNPFLQILEGEDLENGKICV
jgi:hypothetical protein